MVLETNIQTASCTILLYEFVLQTENCLGHGRGYECHSSAKAANAAKAAGAARAAGAAGAAGAVGTAATQGDSTPLEKLDSAPANEGGRLSARCRRS